MDTFSWHRSNSQCFRCWNLAKSMRYFDNRRFQILPDRTKTLTIHCNNCCVNTKRSLKYPPMVKFSSCELTEFCPLLFSLFWVKHQLLHSQCHEFYQLWSFGSSGPFSILLATIWKDVQSNANLKSLWCLDSPLVVDSGNVPKCYQFRTIGISMKPRCFGIWDKDIIQLLAFSAQCGAKWYCIIFRSF